MPPRPAGPQLGLFDNPVRVFGLEELTDTVRTLERQQPGRTVAGLTRAVFAEPGTSEVRKWAASNGFQIGSDGTIPPQAITAYNQTHPGRPY